jgi:hypothetical protein
VLSIFTIIRQNEDIVSVPCMNLNLASNPRKKFTWDVDPFQLQVQHPRLDISQLEKDVLHELPVLPDDGALVCKAAILTRPHCANDGAAADVIQVHLYHLHQRLDVKLCIAHLVVFTEGVLVENLLFSETWKLIRIKRIQSYAA